MSASLVGFEDHDSPVFISRTLMMEADLIWPDVWQPSQAAEVPIVKLNPLDILTVKATGEKELRAVSLSVFQYIV